MALQALKIVQEEIARTRANWDGRVIPPDALDGLEARIQDRIEKECIEIPVDAVQSERCTFCRTGNAVEEYWVRELGDLRDSKEFLCRQCIENLPERKTSLVRCTSGPTPDFDITKDDHVSLSDLLREDPDIPF